MVEVLFQKKIRQNITNSPIVKKTPVSETKSIETESVAQDKTMKQVVLNRMERSDSGTFGRLIIDGFSCHSIELPWRNNQCNISSIPPGTYNVSMRKSNKYGNVYWVKDVTGRTAILIHSGNFAGDTAKGLKTHSHGCILLGQKRGILSGQQSILNSKYTINRFVETMECNDFQLTINEKFKEE